MNKKAAIEATEWLVTLQNFTIQIKEHKSLCKHWSLTDIREVEHHDPQFPKDRLTTCEWCGAIFKNGELWKEG